MISRWPRTDATWSHICDLHVTLRTWYYETGGLYLSENARRRYGSLQELLAQFLDLNQDKDDVDPADYAALMEEASAFRSALTEDLQSREQRSLFSVVRRALLHRKQESASSRRRAAATPPPIAAPTPAPASAASSSPVPSAAPQPAPVGSTSPAGRSAGPAKTPTTSAPPMAASPSATKQPSNQRAGAQTRSRG